MRISSNAFGHNELIPAMYTCDGENVNPPLMFSDMPPNVQSLVLVIDDPDAPDRTWIHWTVWNIGPDTKDIPGNGIPEDAIEGVTSFGKTGYGGPCPPSGTHRYFFKLYALDSTIELEPDADHFRLEKAMEGHILEQAELIGLYQKNKFDNTRFLT